MYEKAKAIVFERPRKAVVKEIRLAGVDEETIVVKTKYSSISSGTEMKVYQGITGSLDGALWYPLVPGYEEVGEVVCVGKNVKGFKVGDRVMANEVRHYPDCCSAWGGQCGYAVKNPKTSPAPQDACAKIPENVSYQEAVVACLACVAKKGMDKARIDKGDTVLVIGMGNIGLSDIQLAGIYGAGKVIAMDIRESRLNLAKKYTDYLIDSSQKRPEDSLKEMNNGKLADVVIECSGNGRVVSELYKYVRQGGRIHLQGDYPEPIIITSYFHWFGLDATVSFTCASKKGDKEAILKLISEGRFDAKSLYSKEYFVDDAPKAYQDLEKNRYDILKILFKWE